MVVGAYLEEKLLKPLREKRRMEREQWIAQRQAEGRATPRDEPSWKSGQPEDMGSLEPASFGGPWERGEPFDEPTPTTQEEP